MVGLFDRFRKKDKDFEIEISKKGANYYCVYKIKDDIVLTIISPPVNFSSDTGVGIEGNADLFSTSASGEVNVNLGKSIVYNKPIILFNHKNKAGLELESVLGEFTPRLKEFDPHQEKFKVDYESLKKHEKVIDVKETKTVSVGATLIELSEKQVYFRPQPIIPKDFKNTIELLLQSTVESLFKQKGRVRANVMLYQPTTKSLKIVASYNMNGDIDEDLEIKIEQGGAGRSFRDKSEEVVDLNLETHEKYGITKKQVWSDMKSILSIPIVNEDDLAIGVLNIDSDQDYQRLEFHKEDKKRILRTQVKIISSILEFASAVTQN